MREITILTPGKIRFAAKKVKKFKVAGNQPCNVLKINEIKGEEVKKTLIKKRWIIHHFYDVTRMIFKNTLSSYK